MRIFGLTLTATLLAGIALQAQTAPAGPAPAAASATLDTVLKNWETAMKGITTLSAELTRTTVEKTFQTKDVYTGYAYYMRPNLAFMHMNKKGRPELYERYLCIPNQAGTSLYRYIPKEKTIYVYPMPQGTKGQVAEDNFLTFLFGMKAEQARQRYQLTLQPAPSPDIAKYYTLILIEPKTPADKRDFTKARLTLLNSNYLPRQLWFEQPTGNEVTWDFPKLTANVKLDPRIFTEPKLPDRTWKFERVRTDLPPRVIRQNQR